MRYLGIDPGLRITGYGCVDGSRGEPKLVEAGVFRLASGEKETVSDRLLELDGDVTALIERLKPEAGAVAAGGAQAQRGQEVPDRQRARGQEANAGRGAVAAGIGRGAGAAGCRG